MARDPKVTRKAYEYKLGKDLASKLDDKQIHLLSEYYNSLSDKETSEIDSKIVQGRNNTELHEMAMGMVEENESKKTPPKPKAKPKAKVTPKPKATPKAQPIEEASNFIPATEEEKEKYSVTPEEAERRHKAFVDSQNKSKKQDKKAVTAIVKKFSTEKKEDTKQQTTNETIDPTILRLLGLEDAFDLDYDTYKTLLREKMAAGRMSKSQIPTEETELLTNEFKRVKSKTGRFKPKKKTVNISKVVQSGRKYNKSAVNTQKLLSGSKEAESTKVQVKGEAVTNSFENINQSLLGIDSLLKGILGEEKKESEQEAKTARKSAQKAEEEKSERSAKKKATSALKGFKAPKMGFLDMIKRFFKNILLGGFILKALDWFQKEENQKKIQNVITFITDNLDKILLGIAAIVGIGIGMKIVGFLTLFTPLIGVMVVALKGLVGVLLALPAVIAGIPGIVPLAIVAGTALLLKGSYDLIRNYVTGGEGATKILDKLDQQLVDAGVNPNSGAAVYRPGAKKLPGPGGTGYERTPEQEKLYQEVLEKRKALTAIKNERNANKEAIDTDFEARIRKVEDDPNNFTPGAFGSKTLTQEAKDEIAKLKRVQSKRKLRQDLLMRLAMVNFLNPEVEAEMVKKGYSETQMQYFRWLALTYGDKITPEMIDDPKNIKKFMKDSGLDDPSKNLNKPATTTTPVPSTTPPVIPQNSLLGQQSSAPTADYGAGSDGGPKGYVIVPGHAAGLGAPGEMEITPQLADNLVANLRKRVGPDVPVTVMNMHAETELTQAAFTKQQDRLKALEERGYEVIELHMDASVESGASPGGGRGVILPMPGTDAINPVEADFAKNYGAFPREHRDGLAGTNRGASLIELGNMSPALQKSALSGAVPKSDLDILTKPLEDSLIRGLGLMEVKPGHSRPEPPAPPNTDQDSTVLPLGGEGSGDTKLSSASGGRAPGASFSSTDKNNTNPLLTGSIFNLTAVG